MGQTLLIFSQTFVPDPAAVGQYMSDVAVAMAARGHRVVVYASGRGYEDPTRKYSRRENLRGVEVHRFPFASFGKRSMPLRVAGTFVFMLQCLVTGLLADADGIFFSTSPPLIGVIAVIIHIIRGIPIAYWAMDLNPDQLIALGKIKPGGWRARFLGAANQLILRESSLVIALDRLMAERLAGRCRLGAKLVVIPPWPLDEHLGAADAAAVDAFRARHGLNGKFVIMYSGNHSPSNPLDTILQAAERLRDAPSLCFAFVGGGSGKAQVEQFIREHRLTNAVCLPYQPLATLGQSLSAADVHVVALGDNMAGIVHPCKIYGAMSVGRPILYLGPEPSHVSDLLAAHAIGRRIAHGDVTAAVTAIRDFQSAGSAKLSEMGDLAQQALKRQLSQKLLRDRLCARLEAVFNFGTKRR
jgi:glycosyltransferase involved in cell wall biosynthesis